MPSYVINAENMTQTKEQLDELEARLERKERITQIAFYPGIANPGEQKSYQLLVLSERICI